MKKIKFLLLFSLISPVLSSCGQTVNEPEPTPPVEKTEDEKNEETLKYTLPFLKQSFTLKGHFDNGEQKFNLTYIYQTSPTETRYKHFEYLDEDGETNGQQTLEIYFEDQNGYAKAYIVDPDNTAKVTSVTSSSTGQEFLYNNAFNNPFLNIESDDFSFDEGKAYLDETKVRDLIDNIYGVSNEYPEYPEAYFTFKDDVVDKLYLEFTFGEKDIKYDLSIIDISTSKVLDTTRKHLPQHDALKEALDKLVARENKEEKDSFLLKIDQGLNPMMASTSANVYFLGDSIYIETLPPNTEPTIYDDMWLMIDDRGLISQYNYNMFDNAFTSVSQTNYIYDDILPGIFKGNIASEVFDYIGDNKYLACRDVLATIGTEFVGESFINLDGVGDQYIVELNDDKEIVSVEFSYTKVFNIQGKVEYLDFGKVTVPDNILSTKPII